MRVSFLFKQFLIQPSVQLGLAIEPKTSRIRWIGLDLKCIWIN